MKVLDLRLDVSDAVPVGEPCAIACSLFVPDELPERPTVVVAQPGGTYSRRYFDLHPPVRSGFSQARHFAARGIVFAAMDYLGGGDSTRPADGERLTLPVLAGAAHAAFERLRDGLGAGAFGLPAMAGARFIGLGFSFGGAITVLQQGSFGDYEAVTIQGYSPIAADNHEGHELPGDWDELSAEARREIVRANVATIVGGDPPVYHGASRHGAWRNHYLPDTDEALIAYDEEHVQTLIPRSAGLDVMTDGFTLPYAREIACPVLLAFAEHDLVADPHRQPAAYPNSDDVTLVVIRDAAHLINFLESRQRLWDRTLAWLRTLPYFASQPPSTTSVVPVM